MFPKICHHISYFSVPAPDMWSPCTRAAWPPSVTPGCCRSSHSASSSPLSPRPRPPAPPWGHPGPAQPHCPPFEDESWQCKMKIQVKLISVQISPLWLFSVRKRVWTPAWLSSRHLPGLCCVTTHYSRLQSSQTATRSHLVSITQSWDCNFTIHSLNSLTDSEKALELFLQSGEWRWMFLKGLMVVISLLYSLSSYFQ